METRLPAPTPLQTRMQAGYTLVEIMAAALILSMAVAAISVLVLNSMNMASTTTNSHQARLISKEEIEDPSRHYFNYAGVSSLTRTYHLNHGLPNSVVANCVVSVNNPTPASFAGVSDIHYRLVTSTLSWQENGETKYIALHKRISRISE